MLHRVGFVNYPENRENTGWRATYRFWKLPYVLPSMRGYISWCPQTAGSDSSIGLVAPMTDELWSQTGSDTIFMFRGVGGNRHEEFLGNRAEGAYNCL